MTFNELKERTGHFSRKETFLDMLITPEFAILLLTLNTKNRKLTKPLIKQYVQDMKDGAWLKTGQNILISKYGVIIDGQHRLEAIKISGFAQVMTIITGMEPEVFSVIDTGRSRTGKDVMSIINPNVSPEDAGILHQVLRNIINLSLGKLSFNPGSKQTVANRIIENFYKGLSKEDNELLNEALEKAKVYFKASKDTALFGKSMYAFLYFSLAKLHKEKADIFFEYLSTGYNLSDNDETSAVSLLRSKLTEMSRKMRFKRLTEYKTAYTFKAWNFFVQGTVVQRLLIRDGEVFPKPVAPKNDKEPEIFSAETGTTYNSVPKKQKSSLSV